MLGCRIVLNDTFYKVRVPFCALCALGQLLSTKCELHLAPFAQWDSYFLQSASSNWRPLRNGTATFYKVRAPFGVLCAMGQLLSTKCELHLVHQERLNWPGIKSGCLSRIKIAIGRDGSVPGPSGNPRGRPGGARESPRGARARFRCSAPGKLRFPAGAWGPGDPGGVPLKNPGSDFRSALCHRALRFPVHQERLNCPGIKSGCPTPPWAAPSRSPVRLGIPGGAPAAPGNPHGAPGPVFAVLPPGN